MDEKNLWGDVIDLVETKTPKSYLKEQGKILEQMTKSILMGDVTYEISPIGKFQYEFDIVAPYLNNYRVTILKVTHGIKYYPLTIDDIINKKRLVCPNEKIFLALLKRTLSSLGVRTVVSSLFAQSKA
ncbi:MAG: hypothetical protein ACLPYB_16160 [Desulfobaccales bacterium]